MGGATRQLLAPTAGRERGAGPLCGVGPEAGPQRGAGPGEQLEVGVRH